MRNQGDWNIFFETLQSEWHFYEILNSELDSIEMPFACMRPPRCVARSDLFAVESATFNRSHAIFVSSLIKAIDVVAESTDAL